METKTRKNYNDLFIGINKGLPIALGYIPVSFTFGLMMADSGMNVWIIILISMTNLTSAGQFAGAGLIIANATLFEITLTTFVINIRYMLMSLSLSQKLVPGITLLKRSVMAFGITDETFAVASLEKGEITFPYMAGLVTCPYWGWALGTALGALTQSILPDIMRQSMGVALYGMFIALFVPASKKSKAALTVVLASVMLSSAFNWLPLIKQISKGWVIIIVTVAASGLGALLFPRGEEEC